MNNSTRLIDVTSTCLFLSEEVKSIINSNLSIIENILPCGQLEFTNGFGTIGDNKNLGFEFILFYGSKSAKELFANGLRKIFNGFFGDKKAGSIYNLLESQNGEKISLSPLIDFNCNQRLQIGSKPTLVNYDYFEIPELNLILNSRYTYDPFNEYEKFEYKIFYKLFKF